MTATVDSKPNIAPSLVRPDSNDVRLRDFPILTPYDTCDIKQLLTSPVTAGVMDPRVRTAAKAWAEPTVNFLPERAGNEREHPKLKSSRWVVVQQPPPQQQQQPQEEEDPQHHQHQPASWQAIIEQHVEVISSPAEAAARQASAVQAAPLPPTVLLTATVSLEQQPGSPLSSDSLSPLRCALAESKRQQREMARITILNLKRRGLLPGASRGHARQP
eukprot:jgi/Tetstr1/455911/TSEL_042692.t1